MARVLLIEAKPSRNSYSDFDFEFDKVSLSDDPTIKKILKKDVTLDATVADDYEWVILVGSEPLKMFTSKTSVMDYSGQVVDDKFLPVINPGMLSFKPEAKPVWNKAVEEINKYVTGTKQVRKYDPSLFIGIQDTQEALDYIQGVIDSPYPYYGLDSETTALYPRDGYVLGISICGKPDTGAYIDADYIDEAVVAKLQELINKKITVFHNAKFDLAFFEFHFHLLFPKDQVEDTMLLHYALDERPGNHGLKQLALQHTEYGDYEAPLHEFIAEYRKKHGILKDDFTWDAIPFPIMKEYAAIDACVTFLIYNKLKAAVKNNPKLHNLYTNILIPGMFFVLRMQENGVPIDKDRLEIADKALTAIIEEKEAELYKYSELKDFENVLGDKFNPNSVQQLRKLLFDYIGLQPTGIKTATTGSDSTNIEALEILGEQHEIPKLILEIRKAKKLKNTYIDKIKRSLDRDDRLRTNFNLHGTTSGRLSSSGKLNLQQLPRDNPAVKGCIKAKPGYKIVAMDLKTAEVYVAAVLSGDTKLQEVFTKGGDFHSNIAKIVFKIAIPVEEIKDHPVFSLQRQAAKAVTFGILFGAGPRRISEEVTKSSGTYFSVQEASEVIDDYFRSFPKLKSWIKKSESLAADNGFLYSHFNRKRRLRNVKSDNRGVVAHEIKSGVNFLIQSVSSDINLLGAIELQREIEVIGINAKIFALVHDSILAEVKEEDVDIYIQAVKNTVQKPRGVEIPGCPIVLDFDIGDDYSFGKFEKLYG